MLDLVVLSLGNGNLNNGFPAVTADLWKAGELYMRFTGSLPAATDISQIYADWQFLYKDLYQSFCWRSRQEAFDDFEIEEAGITNVNYTNFGKLCQQLKTAINQLLNSEVFRNIERQLRTQLKPDEEIQFIIESNDDLVQRLPWHLWNFFDDYPKAEIALSPVEYKKPGKLLPKTPRDKVKILAIFGNPQSHDSLGNLVEIEIAEDLALLKQLPDVEVEVLVEPNLRQLNEQIWKSCWDILFFAGHSSSQEKGRIKLNSTDYLTIDQLSYGLRKAIEQGLQLAIFNSCDSLGLARDLANLHIPQVIVMREPVPDKVAQEFLKYFLKAYSSGQALSTAVREARERLQELETDFHCATWLPVICPNPAVAPPTWQDLGRWSTQLCPYQGLFAFQEEDSRFFFGRKAFTQQLVDAVQQEALVSVIGPSGSGKSSVVFAGLIPHLRSQENWDILSFRPGDRPFHALASELILKLEPHLQNYNDRLRETRKLADDLRQDTGALRDTVEAIVGKNTDFRLLLVADQFEELYTLCEAAERQCFLERLLEVVKAVNHHAPNFALVLTLRADFLDRALSEHAFADFMRYGHQMLGPMNREELTEVIIQPAAQLGVTIEEGLTKRLLDDVNAELDRLPLLEFTLTQLWHKQSNAKLINAAYDEIGGVKEALAQYAEEVYNKLNEEEKERARRIFIQLVQPGEATPDTRRLATRKEIGEENWDLITHLANVRLVITNTHLVINNSSKLVEEETVEIVHEALIEGWFRLQTWVDLDRDFRIWQERLRNSMSQWEESKQDRGALLRGFPLAEAENWLQKRPVEVLNERLFIKQSIELRDKEIKERDRQRRRIILGLSISLLIVSVSAVVAIWFRQKAEDSLEDQINALSRSSEALRNANQEFDALLSAMRSGQPLLTRQIEGKPETLKRVLASLQRAVFQVKERNRLEEHNDEVWGVSFSRDGQTIATASFDRTVKLWTKEGQLLKTLAGHEDGVTGVSFSPDGKIIATTSFDRTVKLWNREGQLLRTLTGHDNWVYGVSFSPNGKTIATAGKDKTIKLWTLDGKLLQTFSVPNPADNSDGGFNSVSFSPDGNTIAAASWDRTVRLWNLRDGKLTTISGSTTDCAAIADLDNSPHCDEINSVNFSPDGNTIATASSDRTVKLWERNGKLIKTLKGHTDEVNSVSFSPDGETIASVSSDKTVKLWSRAGEELKPTLTGHNAQINYVSFSPNGRTIATASFDRTVKLWSYERYQRKTLTGHQNNVWGVAFSPDGQAIATASQDRTITLWNRQGQELNVLKGHTDTVTSVNFSPDGKTIATTSKDRTIKLWSQDGQPIKTLIGHKELVDSLSFSPNGQMFATGSWDGEVKLWDRNGKELRTFRAHIDRVYDISFSPNGQTIATVSRDRTVKLWNQDGALLNKITGHPSQVYSVSFSPDGKTIATASRDQTVKLWNQNGQLLHTLSSHAAQVYSVRFSPDGQLIATTSRDKTVRIWNRNGELLQILSGHADEVDNVSFSPDSKMIATASRDDTVILWYLNIDRLETIAELRKLKLDDLMERSCGWVRDYLKYNLNVGESDKHLCDRIYLKQQQNPGFLKKPGF